MMQTNLAEGAQEVPGAEDGGVESAATRVVAGLPRDQALGLRLMMLARAATAVHMAEGVQRAADGRAGGGPGRGA